MKKIMCMVAIFGIAMVGVGHVIMHREMPQAVEQNAPMITPSTTLNVSHVDLDALCKKINIPAVSLSIMCGDEQMLKQSLDGMLDLNKTITAQIDAAISFWNQYLDTVKVSSPTDEHYLLGKVMCSFLGTLRSLFARSSVDQAMILSLIRKTFEHNQAARPAFKPDIAQAVDVQDVVIEDRWHELYM